MAIVIGSTRAHNVLQIDDSEQCDMWSRFRMGYRGWPCDFQTGGNHGFAWARACHNAYRRLGVSMVGRWIACRANGRGVHQLTHWLHFHPDVQITSTTDNEVELKIGENVARLRHLFPGEISIERAWYCPEFGKRIEAPVVAWSKSCTLPAVSAWCLTWSDGYGDVAVELDDRGTVVVTYAEEEERWKWKVIGGRS